MEGYEHRAGWSQRGDKSSSQVPGLDTTAKASCGTNLDQHQGLPSIDFGDLDLSLGLDMSVGASFLSGDKPLPTPTPELEDNPTIEPHATLDNVVNHSKPIVLSLVLNDDNSRPENISSDLSLRNTEEHQQPCEDQKEQRPSHKSGFRRRFWGRSPAKNFSYERSEKTAKSEHRPQQPCQEAVPRRPIYVPRHAASDFSALSLGPLRTSFSPQQGKSTAGSLRSRASSSSSLRIGPSPLSETTVGSETCEKLVSDGNGLSNRAQNHPVSSPESAQAQSSKSLHGSVRLKRSMSNISAPLPSTHFTSQPHKPLPPTPRDFALFAVQAGSNESPRQPAEVAAAWDSLIQLENTQALQRRCSFDSIASSATPVHSQHRPLSVTYSDDSVTVARQTLPVATGADQASVVRRIQQRHEQQVVKAQRGIGHRIAAYIRPPRAFDGYAPSKQ